MPTTVTLCEDIEDIITHPAVYIEEKTTKQLLDFCRKGW